ncbi:hypothetical protein CRE_30415 [Caenorhabditis remanei]|uniref:Uncharacterized protein n=1 Tax=Caenorhabditis remanei TaxID=31234 RepID=E3NAE9_CAERE|nr:hypothetical protein CRE_30415 [Caenorhabditis remanei]
MASEPMEEDDSFNQPVPRSTPYIPPQQSKKEDSDPESDDSFETFAPTQTTNGGSLKSSASSTQSTGIKAPLPPSRPFQPPAPPFGTQNVAPGAQKYSSKPLPPQLQRSQYSHAPPPSITSTYIQSSQQMSQRVVVQPFRPVINQQNTNKIGVHSAVTNTKKNGDVTTQQQKATSSQAPASPNSLARHRSANSGLRNSPFQTPALRTGNIFIPRTTPPSDPSSRPATPSGDVLMLRDQLENEKRKVMRLQTEFQKDAKKKEDEHQRNLAAKDLIIDKQKKDLEMFKSTIACRKTDIPTSSSFSAPSPILKTPKIPNTIRPMATSTPTLSSTSEIKKVYPKIPAAEPKVKTPRRRAPMTNFGHISAFRHPLKDDEEDDTFQMNASFEPSATSTPKMSGLVRTGLRRPLDLGDDGDENIRGAPTPKRKPVVFKEKRKKRTRKEVQEKIQKIWEGIDKDSTKLSTILNRKDVEKPVEKPPESMETEYLGFGEKYDWVDRILTKKMESVELRKTQPVQTERFLSARVRNRVMNEAEQRKIITKNCANCHMDVEISKPEETPKTERRIGRKKVKKEPKEWEIRESDRRDLLKKEAEERRCLHYTTMLHSINRKGIEEIEGMKKKNELAEQQYRKRVEAVKIRNLDEIREEKLQEWRKQIVSNLEENSDQQSCFEIREVGRNEDYIWTEDERDYDAKFPEPYHLPKSSLCHQCQSHQQRQRRICRKEWEQSRIKLKCLEEFGNERREQMRNASLLTKSRIEAADKSLFRENGVVETGLRNDDVDEEYDSFM